jgi:hypothetical protein
MPITGERHLRLVLGEYASITTLTGRTGPCARTRLLSIHIHLLWKMCGFSGRIGSAA